MLANAKTSFGTHSLKDLTYTSKLPSGMEIGSVALNTKGKSTTTTLIIATPRLSE